VQEQETGSALILLTSFANYNEQIMRLSFEAVQDVEEGTAEWEPGDK